MRQIEENVYVCQEKRNLKYITQEENSSACKPLLAKLKSLNYLITY